MRDDLGSEYAKDRTGRTGTALVALAALTAGDLQGLPERVLARQRGAPPFGITDSATTPMSRQCGLKPALT